MGIRSRCRRSQLPRQIPNPSRRRLPNTNPPGSTPRVAPSGHANRRDAIGRGTRGGCESGSCCARPRGTSRHDAGTTDDRRAASVRDATAQDASYSPSGVRLSVASKGTGHRQAHGCRHRDLRSGASAGCGPVASLAASAAVRRARSATALHSAAGPAGRRSAATSRVTTAGVRAATAGVRAATAAATRTTASATLCQHFAGRQQQRCDQATNERRSHGLAPSARRVLIVLCTSSCPRTESGGRL